MWPRQILPPHPRRQWIRGAALATLQRRRPRAATGGADAFAASGEVRILSPRLRRAPGLHHCHGFRLKMGQAESPDYPVVGWSARAVTTRLTGANLARPSRPQAHPPAARVLCARRLSPLRQPRPTDDTRPWAAGPRRAGPLQFGAPRGRTGRQATKARAQRTPTKRTGPALLSCNHRRAAAAPPAGPRPHRTSL